MSTLRTELQDPRYAAMSDEQAAAELNTANRSRLRTLARRDLLLWAAQGERLVNLEEAAKGIRPVGIKRDRKNIAMAGIQLLTSDTAELNLADPLQMGLVDLLVAEGVLVAGDKTALVAAATETVSRATELGLGTVRVGEVGDARAQGGQ
ncbi:hypothetical protein [Microbacterium sp.]|uniref:hypothetical protein n=1 Tax=Microbacterium sp. TaxID=51671 RepID=UPI0027339285|nr:hypothetical protein [Microbacterium sp.]MDP3950218.1 hypothetical protein [Microbacterium sp.]